jgi:EAL domain-containing protein (putative c-di-GMP-specific phosphodiesterase class I)
MLRKLPFERLKIDRAFVCRIVHDPSDRALVGAMIELAKNLEMTVVAEGVESLEELRSLEDLGCRAHQGYLGSRPVSADAFEPLLRAGRVSITPS